KSDQSFAGHFGTGLEHHDGFHGFAPFWVRHSDHRRFEDVRMAVNHTLDLQWINADTAAFDHVLFASGHEKKTFLVEIAKIAGVKPAVAKRVVRSLGIFVVTVRRQWTVTDDLADFADRYRPVVIVYDPYIDAPDGPSRRARLGIH